MARIQLEQGTPVAKVYGIDFLRLLKLANQTDEWMKAYKFYCDVMHRYPEELSVKQIQWLNKIEKALHREKVMEALKS